MEGLRHLLDAHLRPRRCCWRSGWLDRTPPRPMPVPAAGAGRTARHSAAGRHPGGPAVDAPWSILPIVTESGMSWRVLAGLRHRRDPRRARHGGPDGGRRLRSPPSVDPDAALRRAAVEARVIEVAQARRTTPSRLERGARRDSPLASRRPRPARSRPSSAGRAGRRRPPWCWPAGRAEDLAVDAAHRLAVGRVDEELAGADHVVDGAAELLERSQGDLPAAPGLHRRVGVDAAVRPDRRGAADRDRAADADRAAEADGGLERRPGPGVLALHAATVVTAGPPHAE